MSERYDFEAAIKRVIISGPMPASQSVANELCATYEAGIRAAAEAACALCARGHELVDGVHWMDTDLGVDCPGPRVLALLEESDANPKT